MTPPPTDGIDATTDDGDGGDGLGTIVDVDVDQEMRESFLEYAYSVIYSRALPDARDGLKPVHRRILFQMSEMGLRPDRGHVKSARVVGDVMGKLHPHGDTAIYDALVRMAQPFSMRVPLVDGHGNFGSLDDGPAAYRYTECRMADAALLMTTSLDEDVVDMVPNYDDQGSEPAVLPAAYPNLLVNGAAGIAVGMATNMAPHNLGEVVAAARHLIGHPAASLDELMRFVPGPDLPTGGSIVGLDGVREAYETGRGMFRTRAKVEVTQVTSRRKGLVVTELPYTVGPEKVIGKIKELVLAKKLQGIADIKDLTDRRHGLRLVVEVKSGFNPEAVLAELYRQTPMEDAFSINAVCLVDGQPRTLGLKELLEEFVSHRLEVVLRRSTFRRRKAQERAHIVEGMLLALANIDEVIQVIRTSEDTEDARTRLQEIFELSQVQAGYILDMQLRRLVRLEVEKLQAELEELRATIAELTAVIDDDALLRAMVSDELLEVSARFATPRRTVLLEGSGARTRTTEPLEIPDIPCRVLLSATGRVARTADADPVEQSDARADHDLILAAVTTTTRAQIGVLTDTGRLLRLDVTELPGLPPTAGSPSLRGGAPARELVTLEAKETVVGLCLLAESGPGVALATRQGVVKRVRPEYPANKDAFEMITLADKDLVVGAVQLTTGDEDLVLIASDSQLLRFGADKVRPQGRAGGGIAGISLSPGAQVLHFAAVTPGDDVVVATLAGDSGALAGSSATSAKVSALEEFPAKGRATGGVRAQRFLRGEDVLLAAWVGTAPALAATASGSPVVLSRQLVRRDGSGTPVAAATTLLGGPLV